MSLEQFISEAISPWMKEKGPDADIVLSSRIRLARNLEQYVFPIAANLEQSEKVVAEVKRSIETHSDDSIDSLEMILMKSLQPIEKQVLVEKHLISPHLARESKYGAVLMSKNESISIMINEEDHLRIQCLFPGFQLREALSLANSIDDWMEEKIDYAFEENRGYLTSCPTNVGTGMRASVMMHLPALV
jgi:protein arginine kinase